MFLNRYESHFFALASFLYAATVDPYRDLPTPHDTHLGHGHVPNMMGPVRPAIRRVY